jgi:hypothetical protein
MKIKHKHLSQTQLGHLFGASSHKIGDWLVTAGLKDGKTKLPTGDAHRNGFCHQAPSGPSGYFYTWHADKTVAVLTAAGHRPVADPPEELVEPPALNGPFRVSEADRRTVLNADGTTAVRTAGSQAAETVAKLLNVAHRLGKLPVPDQQAATA